MTKLVLCTVVLACAACSSLKMPTRDAGTRLSNQIAEIMVNSRAYDTATPLLRQGIALDPNDGRLHRLLAQVLRDRGVYEQALTEYMVARVLSPGDPDVAAGLGVLYDLRGQATAAEMWHREALGLHPKRADLYNNLGFSMHLHGDYYSAVAAYRESLRLNPNQPRVYNNLGFTYARMGNMDAALAAFRQGGSKAQAQANMGLAYELDGKFAEARERYHMALRLDQTLDVARHNLRNLDEMGREDVKSDKLESPSLPN